MVLKLQSNLPAVGATGFCDECKDVLFDDGADCFIEKETSDGHLTLTHVQEGSYTVPLDVSRTWDDSLPELPLMAKRSKNGCEVCGFIRKAIIQRQPSFSGPVRIRAGYVWRGFRDELEWEEGNDGLVFFRCEVYAGKGSVGSVTFSIESNDSSLLDWLRVDDKRAPDALKPDVIEWLTAKMKDCENNCDHRKADTSFLPTRLIDVGYSEGDIIRLVDTKDLRYSRAAKDADHKHIEYAALTYCWGPREAAEKQLMTTHDTLSARRLGIAIDLLPPVVRDAVILCRSLAIRYLWIDALCIIQGDKEDWNAESVTMSRVYFSSTLAICPLSSTSCLEGFLGARQSGLDIPFQSSRRSEISGTYTLYPLSDDRDTEWAGSFDTIATCDIDIGRSSWSKRGWTFQEMAMSSRLLMLGSSMCHFVCEDGISSENAYRRDGPNFFGPLRQLITMSAKPVDPGSEPVDDGSSADDPYECWEAIFDVKNRSWTYDQDILPGIAGIASRCAQLTNDEYLAGLWKKDLLHGLLWQALQPGQGSLEGILERMGATRPYIAPSWSWVSRRAMFERFPDRKYPPKERVVEHGQDGLREKPFAVVEALACHTRPAFTLEDHHMNLDGSNSFGRLLPGSFLSIRCKLMPLPADLVVEPRGLGCPDRSYFSDSSGVCSLDWTVESKVVQKRGQMRLVLIASCCSATTNWRRLMWLSSFIEDKPPSLGETMQKGLDTQLDGESYVESDSCTDCQNPESPKTAWGLIVHPSDTPGSYYRIGVFVLFSGSEGTKYFEQVEDTQLRLI